MDIGGRGNYNSLGIKLTKKYSSGITTPVPRTFSKSVDETNGIRVNDGDTLFPQNSYCQRCERGRSTFEMCHRTVTSVLYDLPVSEGKGLNVDNGVPNATVGDWQRGSNNSPAATNRSPVLVQLRGLLDPTVRDICECGKEHTHRPVYPELGFFHAEEFQPPRTTPAPVPV